MLKPKVFVDPMVGSGTSVQVAAEMGIEAYGLDLHGGFNILKQSILDAIGKPSDLCFSHPPYHNIIVYSGNVYGQAHQDDLSRCEDIEDFLQKMQIALLNQKEATIPGGFFGCLIGDVRKNGQYSSLQAELIARMPAKELKAVLIKAQHNVNSDRKSYREMNLPRIYHEYLILWERPKAIISILENIEIMARQDKARMGSTWRSVIYQSLIALGGKATLSQLYDKVAENAPTRLERNQHWREQIRMVLQKHSKMFTSVDRGVWRVAA